MSNDLPVYLIANLHVINAADYRLYEKGFFAILKRYGGEFITYDDHPHTFEGEQPPEGRIILLKFPSEAQAKTWFDDPEYQALSEHRRRGTRLQCLTMVRGLPPRG